MNNKKCILVSLDDNIQELSALAESLGYIVNNIFIQNRKTPDPKYYIGSGKVNEIRKYIQDNNIDLIIFNSHLKPSQHYNLENYIGIRIYDRIGLILEIFSNRAHSEEARLQVELAKLQYEIPLLRDWIHKARYGEKPGFMAGGEYEVAQYYDIIRKRIKKAKEKLKKIEKERDIRRRQRRKLGYYLITIVGYTNAGKSTLFNLISGESIAVEDRLFTTLSTTTRKIPIQERPILLTDTVGLIDNLPHWVIEAFHSTLEEIFLSDLILLLIDVSEPIDIINRKLKISFNILIPDLKPSNIILIFNKTDKIVDSKNDLKDNPNIQEKLKKIEIEHGVRDIISISAIREQYKQTIITSILKVTNYPKKLSFSLPNITEAQSFISWLYSNCDILFIDYKDSIYISLRCQEKDEKYITKTVNDLKGL